MVIAAVMNDTAFKTMYEKIGFTTEAAEKLVIGETINLLDSLRKLDAIRVKCIVKVIRFLG